RGDAVRRAVKVGPDPGGLTVRRGRYIPPPWPTLTLTRSFFRFFSRREGKGGARRGPPVAPFHRLATDQKPVLLALDLVRTDGGTQARTRLDDATVAQYAAVLLPA